MRGWDKQTSAWRELLAEGRAGSSARDRGARGMSWHSEKVTVAKRP